MNYVTGEITQETDESMKRRLGTFTIDREVVDQYPSAVQALLAKTLVLRAEWLYHMDAVEYVARCEMFEETPMGGIPRRYEVKGTTLRNGSGEATGIVLEFDVPKAD